jgi:endonuclease YncB( thermonuclease family)
MPEGLLVARGTISLDLSWPAAESDGDTVKVTLASGDAFSYSAAGDRTSLQPTHAFDGAVVRGAGRKSPIDKKNRVTIRFQGVDTTELHYAPAPLPKKASFTQTVREAYSKLHKEYRRPFGETAPLVLRAALSDGGSSVLPCRVETRVDHPNEVFDTYGRMIGDVIVELDSGDMNLNRFLVQEGWAFLHSTFP